MSAFLRTGCPVSLEYAAGAGSGQFLRASMARRRLNQLGGTLVAGILAGLFYFGVTDLLIWAGHPSPHHEAGYTSSLLFLIPGFPLITAGLDLARLDLTAGISRLTYALLVVAVSSVGAWVVTVLFDLVPQTAPALTLSDWNLIPLQFIASFCGVFGFASIFNTPPRIALAAALIGAIANLGRLQLVEFDVPLQAAAPCATLLVGILAHWVSPRLRCPRIVLSVPAVLIMIPGTTAYRALVYANQGMSLEAMTSAYETTFIIAGIATGLALARLLTDGVWAFEDQLPGSKRA
ncbi:threonine/serine exporter family protein [Thiorhodococcus mannitoliphagus]|uniref:threonine/serine exporter family protein n=1 Tax=Thiorhodococcus mannitoliphagus TaxID=329406 RepID=UPI0023EFFFF3|nr:threonine/serine exporter family protein [Thiorhodococcus mannitoliphagus]